MRNSWIVVADEARAKLFFKTAHNEHPVLLREFNNISGHAWERMFMKHLPADHYSHSPGIDLADAAVGVDDPDLMHAQRFATDLCELLELAANRGAYDQLVLAAPDSFLQILRREMGPSARGRLAGSLAKMLMNVPGAKLDQYLGLSVA
jgi:protein required for attachment to host cells